MIREVFVIDHNKTELWQVHYPNVYLYPVSLYKTVCLCVDVVHCVPVCLSVV